MTLVPRLLVVDDNPVVVQWVESALAGRYSVTGAAGNDDIAGIARRIGAAAILVAPDAPALAAGTGGMRRAVPGVRIILFADLPTVHLADDTERLGADGYLKRAGDGDAFGAGLDSILNRKASSANARPPKPSATAEPATDSALGKRAVVIADSSTGLGSEPVFAQQAFQVRRAGSGGQAAAMLRTGSACLLVVGPSLEDMRVDDLVNEVRADPNLRRTSILFVGEQTDAPAAAAATGAGANVALLRPLGEGELIDAVTRLTNVAPRRTTRLLVRLQVETAADDFRVGFTRDVSSSGMLLEADGGLAVGSRVRLSFFVPGKSTEVSAEGEVVRVHDLNAARTVVGVRFITIGTEDRGSLGAFVAAKSQNM